MNRYQTSFARSGLVLLLAWTTLGASICTSATAQTPPFVRTVVVSPVIGNPIASGNALRSAVNGISASVSDPWLVKLEPGTYDLGSSYLQMKSFVDIEGSGPLQTTIRGVPQATLNMTTGVVRTAAAELRNLKVECDGTGSGVGCIAVAGSGFPRLSHLVIEAHGGSGPLWGIYDRGASPRLTAVRIVVSGGSGAFGISNASAGPLKSRPVLSDSTITVKNATGDNVGIANHAVSSPRLLERVAITVSGGSSASGIRGLQATATADVTALDQVTITAFGSQTTYALRDGEYGLAASRCHLNAWGASSHGIVMPLAAVKVANSEISGTLIRASADILDLGSVWARGAGTITGNTSEACAGVFDANFVHYPSTCP